MKNLRQMKIVKNKSIKQLNTMKVDSIFEFYSIPKSLNELREVLIFAKENNLEMYILGNGSNTLFSKKNYKNSILIDLKGINKIYLENNYLYCEAGVLGRKLINFCIKKNIGGFEFLTGIPGSVGGFLKMNAGSFGKNISDIVDKIKILKIDTLECVDIDKNQVEFEYRAMKIGNNIIILGAWFNIFYLNGKKIKSEIKKNIKIRREKQPRGFSFGSVFKNGKDYYAGKLIEKAGLKGITFGDAEVSEKHANFIINRGNATGEDILNLIEKVETEVFDKFNIQLKREVVVY